jgi:hypothetical protein|nr:MAG TPA: hypothetical protein [Crassvirales sp.]
MKFTKESILKSLNSLTMPAWIKRVFQLIVDYIDDAVSSINNKADLVDGKVPAEQLPSYVDDVIEFESIINGSNPINFYLNNQSYTDKVYYIQGYTSIEGTLSFKYNKKFINFGTNTSEDDWIIVEPEEGKIYINIGSGNNSNHSFRWSGSDLIDLDKNWSTNIATLNNIVKVANIGTVSNIDDIAEGDQTGLNQTGMGQLFSFLINYKSYRNTYIEFKNEDLDGRLCRIVDINGGQRQFTIYNNGSLQTYKQLNTGGKYSLEKISDIPGYVYFYGNGLNNDNNKAIANTLEVNRTTPALLVTNEYVYIGYCTKINEGTTTFIVFNKRVMETYSMNNLTGAFTFINRIDTDTIVNYDSIRGSKTNAEAKQELTNILAGDTVVLDYNNIGQALDNNTINALKKANSIILLNDDGSRENSKSIYNIVARTNTYLYFCRVQNLESNGASLGYNQITVNLNNSVWNIDLRKFTLPYGAFLAEGYTGKSQAQVNKEIANVSLLNSYKITTADLNKELTGDKLTNIKNATYLILDEVATNRIFVRGYTAASVIYYNCISNYSSIDSIILRTSNNTLSAVENSQTDGVVYTNYKRLGGTKASKDLMYKELAAQLTENTFVIDASKLGTTLTNEEAATVQEATTLIVTNIPDIGTLVFNRGNVNNTEIHFNAVFMAFMDSIYIRRILYNKNTKLLNAIQAQISNPFQWYLNNGGIIAIQADFTALNNFLYDHTFIIDKTLLNTTISDTAIQNGIKRANILVVKDSTDNSYTVYIKGVSDTDSCFFYNIHAIISTTIDAKRIEFKISTNVLSANTVYFLSAFKNYQLGGGTKYTTESAFNAQFTKIIDMTVTE